MHRRKLAALTAAVALAATALAPAAANARYYVPKMQPPSCDTSIANVVYGDPACEPTDEQP